MRAAGAVHHSDQGSQYTSFAFTRRLAAEGLVGNTGTVGDGLDNAMPWPSGVASTGRG